MTKVHTKVEIKKKTISLISKKIKQINKKKFGSTVLADELIFYAVSQITREDIKAIKNKSRSLNEVNTDLIDKISEELKIKNSEKTLNFILNEFKKKNYKS